MEYSGSSRRPCFIKEDDGLASLPDMEPGISGTHYHGFIQTKIGVFLGDTPLCSEECRQEQIEIDKAMEKNRNISSSMKALRNME
ncbi:hypothetical protein V6N13_080897 [Hibiscus sabdariffa]|uniref:FLZ-type domain-containing protein n=1 Tax=Hibiscus sabdariffa TaxID=183260 RepID=A0ABR2NSG1_9ROSI